jgi:SulP family sulfate permease
MFSPLRPKLYLLLKGEGYSFSIFLKDLFSGIIVGVLALPMSLAFAIASGVRPEQGLYTAIVAGVVIAMFGGSRFQVSGPTGAFVVLIYSIVGGHGYEGLVIATIMAGILLISMGLMRFGALIKYVPYPVTIGFTSGLAVCLFSGQVKDLIGLKLEKFPLGFLERWQTIFSNLHTVDFSTLCISLFSLFIMIYWKNISSKVPAALIAILGSTLLVSFFSLSVETIADRFGEIPSTLPSLKSPPNLSWSRLMQLVPSAIAIALLAGIESLLSAVVADGMTGRKHISDMELIGAGLGNIFSVLFGGIPATGAIARTAANIKNGGKTPFAAIIHSISLALILLCLATYVKLIPMATLAVIITVVAYNMSEWRHFKKLFLSPSNDILILLTTFFLTVFVDLVTAIEAGVILAALLFMRHMSKETKIEIMNREESYAENRKEGIEIFEIRGPLFFGAIEKLGEALSLIHYQPKILILKFDDVPMVDASGIRSLDQLLEKTKREKTLLLFSGVKKSLHKAFEKALFLAKFDEENIFSDLDNALKFAYTQIETKKQFEEVIS